jgi:acetolactate synthase-1/2/3 large subunit
LERIIKITGAEALLLSLQVCISLLGSDAFQETDIISISMPVTKWNYQITRAEKIPDTIAKAFYFATTDRPGPVLIDITRDVQLQEFNYHYKKIKYIRSYEIGYQYRIDRTK